jgi:hypothetical protein
LGGLKEKLKEVLFSVLPITGIVVVLNFTICPIDSTLLYAFLIGSVMVIVGLTLFLFGIDQGLDPIGHGIGNTIANSKSFALTITICLVIGFFISFAEPDLGILAGQVDRVTAGQLTRLTVVIVVSVGIAVMMTLGMLRIIRGVRLRYVFAAAYGLIFILSLFSSQDIISIAFDASGATTGAITVPFMLAIAGGVSALKKDSKKGEEDSFGLVGISSTGAILGIVIAGLIFDIDSLGGSLPEEAITKMSLLEVYSTRIANIAWESFLSLLPIIIVYIVFQLLSFKHHKNRVVDIVRGFIFTFVGLVIFLLGVNGGFMAVGTQIGQRLAEMESTIPVMVVALLLGLTTVLAEPAVHVLTNQIEDVTGGYVRRVLVLVFLSIAVGLSIFMSALRILIPGLRLWMYLLPGFGIAVILAFFVPDLFVGMAFDAGGVASGPMTATFSLAFVQGVANRVPTADLVTDGFGMIAIVAMMPIIAIELLGALYQVRTRSSPKTKVSTKIPTGGNHG